MTEETKQQIHVDAVVYAIDDSDKIDYDRQEDYMAGAIHQDPIAEKRGYNLAVDEAIDCVKLYSPYSVHVDVIKKAILMELEKMRK